MWEEIDITFGLLENELLKVSLGDLVANLEGIARLRCKDSEIGKKKVYLDRHGVK
jgi:hypothetical protein